MQPSLQYLVMEAQVAWYIYAADARKGFYVLFLLVCEDLEACVEQFGLAGANI